MVSAWRDLTRSSDFSEKGPVIGLARLFEGEIQGEEMVCRHGESTRDAIEVGTCDLDWHH
jgi:hypothetical protein